MRLTGLRSRGRGREGSAQSRERRAGSLESADDAIIRSDVHGADNRVVGRLDDGCELQARLLIPLALRGVDAYAGHSNRLTRALVVDDPALRFNPTHRAVTSQIAAFHLILAGAFEGVPDAAAHHVP